MKFQTRAYEIGRKIEDNAFWALAVGFMFIIGSALSLLGGWLRGEYIFEVHPVTSILFSAAFFCHYLSYRSGFRAGADWQQEFERAASSS